MALLYMILQGSTITLLIQSAQGADEEDSEAAAPSAWWHLSALGLIFPQSNQCDLPHLEPEPDRDRDLDETVSEVPSRHSTLILVVQENSLEEMAAVILAPSVKVVCLLIVNQIYNLELL